MELSRLKFFRNVVPGTLILLGLSPLYFTYTNEILNFAGFTKFVLATSGIICSYAIGAIYNLYCIRSIFNKASHTNIKNNIKERLIDIGKPAGLTEEKRATLIAGNELMEVFYSLIDSNESLREKAKLVRANGLIWTSLSDITVIGAFFSLLYIFILFFHFDELIVFCLMVSILATFIAGIIFHPQAVKRHIELSNQQINFIRVNLLTLLKGKIDTL